MHAVDVQPPSAVDDRPHASRTLVVSVLGKGGSGKSSTTACIGDALQRLTRWSVALVDLDSQPSLTQWLTAGVRDTLVEALRSVDSSAVPFVDVAVDLRPGLTLLPAHDGLADLDAADLDARALRHAFAELDGHASEGRAAVAVIDTPAWQPITSDTTLLRAAVDVADVVVVPFNVGRKGVRAMVGVLADLPTGTEGGSSVPVLLLPANVDRPAEVEAAVELARWLRPDLTFTPPVQHVSTAMRRAEDRGRLLADDSPRSPAVLQYRAAAEVLADTLRRIGGTA